MKKAGFGIRGRGNVQRFSEEAQNFLKRLSYERIIVVLQGFLGERFSLAGIALSVLFFNSRIRVFMDGAECPTTGVVMGFRERLKRGEVLLLDGAMGTMLQKLGMPTGVSPERFCLENPALLRSIHESYLEAGADIITFHIEAARHPHRIIQDIKAHGCKAGIALNPGTPLAMAEELFEYADLILLMTVNPGYGGQKFITSMLDKVKRLRDIIDESGLPAVIEVDGGVNLETAHAVAEAGAEILVAGSAVYKADDMKKVIETMQHADECHCHEK